MSLVARISAKEYLDRDWPRDSQLVEGEVIVNDPAWLHQRTVGTIFTELRIWSRAEVGRGEAGLGCNWVIDSSNVFKPDVWWVGEDRRPAREAVWLDGAPDLAVEVRSPGTWRYDVGAKRAAYERAGLPELWLVDTAAETVLLYRRSAPALPTFDLALELDRAATVTSPSLGGLALPVVEIFTA
ncbi:MAG: Uma2 family endonuclease [Acidimicrobiales bacterium]